MTLFGLTNLTFGGVILLKLFDPSYGFGATDGKKALFWRDHPWKSPKLWLRSKSFRSMTPPKVRFARPNKVFWGQKSFLGPPKIKKIIPQNIPMEEARNVSPWPGRSAMTWWSRCPSRPSSRSARLSTQRSAPILKLVYMVAHLTLTILPSLKPVDMAAQLIKSILYLWCRIFELHVLSRKWIKFHQVVSSLNLTNKIAFFKVKLNLFKR